MTEITQIQKAESLIEASEFKRAIKLLDALIQENTNNYEALILRGIAHFNVLNTEHAVSDLNKAISINPNADKAYWNLSEIYVIKSDFPQARKYILKALAIDKENRNYIADLANIEMRLKNFHNAIELCSIILEDNATNLFGLGIRSYCYIQMKEYDKAIYDLNILVHEDPNDVNTLNNLGFALLLNGKHIKSRQYFNLAIEKEPGFSYPYDNLGHSYYLEQEYDKALNLTNKSLELDPMNSWAYKTRALIYIAQNQKSNARKDLETALELGYQEDYDDEVDILLKKIRY